MQVWTEEQYKNFIQKTSLTQFPCMDFRCAEWNNVFQEENKMTMYSEFPGPPQHKNKPRQKYHKRPST